MTVNLEVNGADQFLQLSKALKEGGQAELRKQLHTGMRQAAKTLLPQATQALADALPAGLAARAAKTKQVVQVKTGGDPGITIGIRYGDRGRGMGASNVRRANNQGVIRHPLFGDRDFWFNTPVSAATGWFDRTYLQSAPVVRPQLEQAMQNVVETIIREARRG